jgi:hypothetical protein
MTTATTTRPAIRTSLFGALVARSGLSVRDVARDSTLSVPTVLNLCRANVAAFQARTLALAAQWLTAQFRRAVTPDRAREAITQVVDPDAQAEAAERFLDSCRRVRP